MKAKRRGKGQTEVRERLTERIRERDECKVPLMTCVCAGAKRNKGISKVN